MNYPWAAVEKFRIYFEASVLKTLLLSSTKRPWNNALISPLALCIRHVSGWPSAEWISTVVGIYWHRGKIQIPSKPCPHAC